MMDPRLDTVTYHCIRCHEPKRGRFTTGETVGSPHGWSQHRDRRVNWICWDCLPYGQGARPPEPLYSHPDEMPEQVRR